MSRRSAACRCARILQCGSWSPATHSPPRRLLFVRTPDSGGSPVKAEASRGGPLPLFLSANQIERTGRAKCVCPVNRSFLLAARYERFTTNANAKFARKIRERKKEEEGAARSHFQKLTDLQPCRARERRAFLAKVPRAPWETRRATRRSPSPVQLALDCSSPWGVSTGCSR